ncbi:unnamed protein product [Prorocentrum cordatum]|uniref:Uncharacterized protein n=1 Tax=Prorocentrum cordatum TaxID=2364126 RepID=A0ABN9SNU6_9DINO|nr:unnamed protein product [Polarella glacialis]|mmetsp:Transcript_102478/g.290262  ORF Transcript_102478/g.290262 Transcript_102478/m.290262 type:complete len:109 (-) Transcript_102478:42-368(-)
MAYNVHEAWVLSRSEDLINHCISVSLRCPIDMHKAGYVHQRYLGKRWHICRGKPRISLSNRAIDSLPHLTVPIVHRLWRKPCSIPNCSRHIAPPGKDPDVKRPRPTTG